MSDQQLYTSEEVSEIVRKRVAKIRTIPFEALRSMLLDLADRIDAIEEEVGKIQRGGQR